MRRPGRSAAPSERLGRRICGRKSRARTIGPATRCGKNGDEQAESAIRLRSAGILPSIHVHHVVDGFKGVERDADGGEDLKQRHRTGAAHGVEGGAERLEEEVGVFEVGEKSDVHQYAAGDDQPAAARGDDAVEEQRETVIDRGGGEDDDGQPLAPGCVEGEAGDDQENDAGLQGGAPAEGPVDEENGGEEGQKGVGTEEHGRLPFGFIPPRKGEGAPEAGADRTIEQVLFRRPDDPNFTRIGKWRIVSRATKGRRGEIRSSSPDSRVRSPGALLQSPEAGSNTGLGILSLEPLGRLK